MTGSQKLKPLEKIEIIGKRGGEEPFPIIGCRGLYFYISTEDFNKLSKINELCKNLPGIAFKPLERIRIVGRGGLPGYRPFMLKGLEKPHLCIPAGELRKLKELNFAYSDFLEREAKREKKIEAKKEKAETAIVSLRKGIEGAKEVEAQKYVPELMQEVEGLFDESHKLFNAEKYDKAIKLISRALELTNYAKSESLRKAKLKVPEAKYLYCIIPAPKKYINFGNIGIGSGGGVYTINYKDIAAVVSDSPVEDYPVSEETSRAHENVVKKVLGKHTVVPAAFGQVFKNQKILRILTKKAYKALKECTKLVDKKIELGVKAILPKEMALDEKKKNENREIGENIFKTLNKKAVESVKGKLFSDRLILNASFLVDKKKMKDFSKEVGKLSKKYKNLKLRYSGPWPPYSFVCIKIGAKGIEVGKREVR
ncbi:MAG: GvpL/GvpF family gas vesicle protein [Candidatus Thermoplasmatota archaeon]